MVQFKKDIFAQHNEKDGSYQNSFVYYLLYDWMREKRVVEKLEKHPFMRFLMDKMPHNFIFNSLV